MAQYSLKDYVTFITKLLECPEGGEWNLLNQYDYLINLELVQMMEQIAQNLMRQGDARSANFLHRWSQEIHQQLTRNHSNTGKGGTETSTSEPRTGSGVDHTFPLEPEQNRMNAPPSQDAINDEIIQALLDCSSGHEHQILKNYSQYLNPRLVARMEAVAQQLSLTGNAYHAQYLMDIATQLERALAHQELSSSPADEPSPQRGDGQADERTDGQPEGQPEESIMVPSVTLENEELQIPPDPLSQQLSSLVQTLTKVTDAIASYTSSSPPLYYLDVLEKAQANEWLLTTHELETLLGAKPHCTRSQNDYHRGGWRFRRCGKVGRDTLWQIFKLGPEELKSTVIQDAASHNTASQPELTVPEIEPDPWVETTA